MHTPLSTQRKTGGRLTATKNLALFDAQPNHVACVAIKYRQKMYKLQNRAMA